MSYSLFRPLLFRLDPENAHDLTLSGLSLFPDAGHAVTSPRLATRLAGLDFPNPVGLAPGFDKDARVAPKMFRFGFGFVEVGTLTPRPQAGNDRPRLFRLVEDRAVINRMGFNNGGQAAALARIAAYRTRAMPGPLGINIGANKDSADRIADYAAGAAACAPLADYLTVNISSPNTPGLRALQDKAALEQLLAAVKEACVPEKPVFLKVAPDLEPADIDDIVTVCLDQGVAALIIGNTTITRPPLQSAHAGETGGLSGAPLAVLARARLADFRKASGGALPLIAAGGIDSAAEAYARIRAGATLVQFYSAMIYAGPYLARAMAQGLDHLLARDGFAHVADAVGVDG